MVFFDADIAAASQRGVHMLVGFCVRGHKVQQTLQECAHLLCRAQVLHQAVLVHFVWITCFQVYEQEPKRALADVLKQFFDLFGSKTAANFLQYGFALQTIRKSRPHKRTCEIYSYDIRQRAEFLCCNPQISTKVPRSNCQHRDLIVIAMHNPLVVN